MATKVYKILVADAEYRCVAPYCGEDANSPETLSRSYCVSDFNPYKDASGNPVKELPNYERYNLPPVVTQDQLNNMFTADAYINHSEDDLNAILAHGNTEPVALYKANQFRVSTTVGGILPSAFDMAIIYYYSEYIDKLDPTLATYPGRSLTGAYSGGTKTENMNIFDSIATDCNWLPVCKDGKQYSFVITGTVMPDEFLEKLNTKRAVIPIVELS